MSYGIFSFGWPYAAKVVAQYTFVEGSLVIYLTFPEGMNTELLPIDSKFTITVDGTVWPVDVVSWLDAYTIRIDVEEQEPEVMQMFVSYAGAGPEVWPRGDPSRRTLEMTTGKQWEPWSMIPTAKIEV
jgi:hypothetical protein